MQEIVIPSRTHFRGDHALKGPREVVLEEFTGEDLSELCPLLDVDMSIGKRPDCVITVGDDEVVLAIPRETFQRREVLKFLQNEMTNAGLPLTAVGLSEEVRTYHFPKGTDPKQLEAFVRSIEDQMFHALAQSIFGF